MLCSLHSNITINTLFPSPSPFNSQQLKRKQFFEQAKPLLIARNKEDGGFHY
jgi:hypothetical protein